MTAMASIVITVGVLLASSMFTVRAENLSTSDRKFIIDAYRGSKTEILIGHLGVEQASGKAAKELAQKLIQDHTKASQELATLARQKGVSLPEHVPEARVPGSLSEKKGEAFDKELSKVLVEDHERDIKTFEDQVTAGEDSDIKAWADKMLPMLRTHLAQARALDMEKP